MGPEDVPSAAEDAGRPGTLRAVILLAGLVRPNRFTDALGRSLLDLPLEKGVSVLGSWLERAEAVWGPPGEEPCRLRVLVGRTGGAPEAPASPGALGVSVERDPLEYRGTGGVIADICRGYAADDVVLVANATQLPREDLGLLVRELARDPADFSLVAPGDGTPSSLFLVRCGALSRIPKVGFVDLKEQAMARIAEHHRVRVLRRPSPVNPPVRTLSGYLTTLRHHHASGDGGDAGIDDPFGERLGSTFSIVEDGAVVGDGARIMDSVVLSGGVVGAGAVVIRSVVGPGGRVGKGKVIADRVVGAPVGRGAKGKGRGE